MLKTFLKCGKVARNGIRLIHQKSELPAVNNSVEISEKGNVKFELVEKETLQEALKKLDEEKPKSVLEKCEEDLSHVAPYLKPTFNLAAYVNKSETLQELLKLGVDLYQLEKKKDVASYITSLNFKNDIKEHVVFLYNLGISVDDIGKFITKNPLIFKEDLDTLNTRIAYLKFKKFDDQSIARIVSVNPMWLKFSTQDIDNKLGFFQNRFHLSGNEVRKLATKQPKLITCSEDLIKVNIFSIKEEMGFSDGEMKMIIMAQPKIFMRRHENILKTFDFLNKTMGISNETIVKNPQILTCREHKLKERYQFLQKVNRVQFDPKKPNYVSLLMLVSESDGHFAVEVAKSSIQAYNEFLKAS